MGLYKMLLSSSAEKNSMEKVVEKQNIFLSAGLQFLPEAFYIPLASLSNGC